MNQIYYITINDKSKVFYVLSQLLFITSLYIPDKVWEYNMFGRSLYDMVNDGMTAKLSHMPDESREKLGQTLGKIINEGSNGLICILL